MEASYRNIPEWFAKYSIEALEDKVVFSYESLVSEYKTEIPYQEMLNKTLRGKQADESWSAWSYSLILFPLIGYLIIQLFFPIFEHSRILSISVLLLIALGVLSFIMRFIKEEFIWFYDKDNNVVFSINISRSNREYAEEMIKFIERHITDANPVSSTKAKSKSN